MNEQFYLEEDEDEDESVLYAVRPNKTRIKKEIADVMTMAEEISQLSASHIAEFELPESIEQALLDAGKMGQNAARKRLLKYITAQLRLIDTQAVQEKLDRMKNRSAHGVREYPNADIQHLRQLQRNAQKEAKEAKPPKSSRLIYKYVKELISGEAEQS
jgi:ribosome-associated protein